MKTLSKLSLTSLSQVLLKPLAFFSLVGLFALASSSCAVEPTVSSDTTGTGGGTPLLPAAELSDLSITGFFTNNIQATSLNRSVDTVEVRGACKDPAEGLIVRVEVDADGLSTPRSVTKDTTCESGSFSITLDRDTGSEDGLDYLQQENVALVASLINPNTQERSSDQVNRGLRSEPNLIARDQRDVFIGFQGRLGFNDSVPSINIVSEAIYRESANKCRLILTANVDGSATQSFTWQAVTNTSVLSIITPGNIAPGNELIQTGADGSGNILANPRSGKQTVHGLSIAVDPPTQTVLPAGGSYLTTLLVDMPLMDNQDYTFTPYAVVHPSISYTYRNCERVSPQNPSITGFSNNGSPITALDRSMTSLTVTGSCPGIADGGGVLVELWATGSRLSAVIGKNTVCESGSFSLTFGTIEEGIDVFGSGAGSSVNTVASLLSGDEPSVTAYAWAIPQRGPFFEAAVIPIQ